MATNRSDGVFPERTDVGVRTKKTLIRGFTLVELLTVIAVIGVLAVLLLPALSKSRAEAHSSICRARLHDIGLAMQMYLSDAHRYPSLWDSDASELCFGKLTPYSPLAWTNVLWHCPTYVRNKGQVYYHQEDHGVATSYCYNWRGVANGWPDCPRWIFQLKLGLGHLSKDSLKEPEVLRPSEMYTVADVRPTIEKKGLLGNVKMAIWHFAGSTAEARPPHSEGYNVLFGDSHVVLVKRRDYLFPPRTAHHWNRDDQAHEEAWAPRGVWAVAE